MYDFITKAKVIHGKKYKYHKTKYTRAHNPLIITCPMHGDFTQKAYVHLNGRGCSECGKESKRQTTEHFIKISREVHGDKYGYTKSKYKGTQIDLTITCPVHGDFNQKPQNHYDGKGCVKCGIEKNRKQYAHTTEMFNDKAKSVHGDKYLYDRVNYTNRRNEVKIGCKIHGYFDQAAEVHLRGFGCSKCSVNSNGELKVREYLLKNNIKFIEQYKFPGSRYPFDFFLVDLNIMIEYDGKQHYVDSSWGGAKELKNVQHRDMLKDKLCIDNNIPLIRIPYWEFKTLDRYLKRNLKMSEKNKIIKEIDVNVDGKYTAIVYSDGSCGPTNPGFYGSGMHGYIFRECDLGLKNNDKPPLGNVQTNLGYTDAPIGSNPSLKIVKPVAYFNAMIMFGEEISTNNVAEIVATTKMMRYLLDQEYEYEKIVIKSDSKYTLGIYHKLMNKKSLRYDYKDIPELKNAEHYKIIDELVEEAKEKGVEIVLKKVEGHSTNLGNNLADRLAVTARVNSERGMKGDYIKFYPGQKYWKPTPKKHPFLRVNQLFYTKQDREVIGKNKYVIMDYDTDIEWGKKTNGVLFGIVELKSENSLHIEELIKVDDSLGDLSILSFIDLTVYYSQLNTTARDLAGTLIYTEKKNHLEVMCTTPILGPAYPQGLAKASLDKALTLNECLENYKKYVKGEFVNNDKLYYVDITDIVYDKTGKKCLCILDSSEKFLKPKITIGGKEHTLIIPLKRELVDRNTLKQLEKSEPKVLVEINIINDKTISYNTVVDTGDELGVYTNFYTAKTIL